MKVGKCNRRSVKSDVRIVSFDHSYRRRGCGTKADGVVTNEVKGAGRRGTRRAKIEDKQEALACEARPEVTASYRQ